MVLPGKETVQDIRNLISEITGFGEEEENFYLCEQYCLSHVMHHSYPSVNKNEVKRLLDGYVLRFFIQGSFKVADGLDAEVKNFLSCDTVFKKNPEFEIQWTLLSLMTSLATNLTSVTKLPKMMPLVEEEKPVEEINWAEYLKEGLPNYQYHHSDEDSFSDRSFHSENSESSAECEEKAPEENFQENKEKTEKCEVKEVTSIKTFHPSRQHIIDELVRRREEEIGYRRDIILRGRFIDEIGFFTGSKLSWRTSHVFSEFELVGYVLKQFLTGENIFKKKGITNPATCSLTEDTVRSYLSTLQPYVNMIAAFKEFSNEVAYLENVADEQSRDAVHDTEFREKIPKPPSMYSNIYNMSQSPRRTVPKVVKLYDMAMREALNLFESKILSMSEYQNGYTLLRVLYELRPSFGDLSSLFALHLSATANWLNEPNWLCSVRIILTLYKAVLLSTSNRMGFLYMNMFLHCFQAYLDITDSWISCLYLNDPCDEFIIYKTKESSDSGPDKFTYNVRPYKDELARVGLKEIEILDYLADKMIQVGHSIDVLHRLEHSVIKEEEESNSHQGSLYENLLSRVKAELKSMRKCEVGGCEEAEDGVTGITNVDDDDSEAGRDQLASAESLDDLTCNQFALNEFCMTLCYFDCDKENLVLPALAASVLSKDIHGLPICIEDERGKFSKAFETTTYKKMAGMTEGTFPYNDEDKLGEHDEMDHVDKSIWPLCMKMDVIIKDLINSRIVNTCDVVKEIVLNEFKLKTHLNLLRSVYMFNQSYLIQPLTNALFNGELLWRNSYALTPLLRECIESRYGDMATHFTVVIEESSSPMPDNVLEAINRITINYQVQWPLQLMFNSRVMKLYNEIFRNLLKILWAHETLCNLKFNDKNKGIPETAQSPNRRLELLRFWCLSSLARLRSYFMTQISMPFDLEMNSFRHFKLIIEAHEVFVKKIHSRCLLDEERLEERELIFNVLIPLCHDVYLFWSSERAIPPAKLAFIENLFFTSQKQFPRLMARLEE